MDDTDTNGAQDDRFGGPPAYVFSDDDDETGLTPARAAATLIVFHQGGGDGAAPSLLMVERSKKMAFAAGAAVFPGGRVDDDDHALGELFAGGIAARDAAARVAAIRETIEETGLAIGLSGDGSDGVASLRAGLLSGERFSDLLDAHGLRLDLEALVPFARWRPNFAHARVFDARFYLARVEGAAPELTVDATENSALFWGTAEDVLARADAGALDIIFPTRRNLERLATFGSYDEAVASARRFPPRRITPWVEERNGARYLCLRDDCGYPVTSEPFDSAMRG